MKVIITENMAKQLLSEQILDNEAVRSVINTPEFEKGVKKVAKETFKNDKDVEKEMEERVKKMCVKMVNNMFKLLWQRSHFYEGELWK